MPINKLRSALPDVIGRTIQHIVFSDHENFAQVFLYFTDGTYYEFYGPAINGIRHLDRGRMELHREGAYIPAKGRLEVVDTETTIVHTRPLVTVTPTLPAPTPPTTLAAKWGHSVAFWLR
jgi:hypothetical protein